MSLADRSARAVDRALARLGREYGDVPTVETEWRLDAEEHDRTVARFEAGSLGGAGAWVVRDDGAGPAALMVRHEGETGWSEPAGKHEPGESLAATARRETREETGIDCEPTGVVRAQRAVHVAEDREPLCRLVVVFAAEYVGGEVRPRAGEIAGVGWFRSHPEDLRYPGVAAYPIE